MPQTQIANTFDHANEAELTVQIEQMASHHMDLTLRTIAQRKVDSARRVSGTAAVLVTKMGGKVGKVAAETAASEASFNAAAQVLSGNFKPAVQALATMLGKSIEVRNRNDWASLELVLRSEVQSTPAKTSKKTGLPTGHYKAVLDASKLYAEINALASALAAKKQQATLAQVK